MWCPHALVTSEEKGASRMRAAREITSHTIALVETLSLKFIELFRCFVFACPRRGSKIKESLKFAKFITIRAILFEFVHRTSLFPCADFPSPYGKSFEDRHMKRLSYSLLMIASVTVPASAPVGAQSRYTYPYHYSYSWPMKAFTYLCRISGSSCQVRSSAPKQSGDPCTCSGVSGSID